MASLSALEWPKSNKDIFLPGMLDDSKEAQYRQRTRPKDRFRSKTTRRKHVHPATDLVKATSCSHCVLWLRTDVLTTANVPLRLAFPLDHDRRCLYKKKEKESKGKRRE